MNIKQNKACINAQVHDEKTDKYALEFNTEHLKFTKRKHASTAKMLH